MPDLIRPASAIAATACSAFRPATPANTRRRLERQRLLRRLLWAYFWLLVLEGAARKWFLPQFAGPLLIVRDPLAIAIYFLASRDGLFQHNAFSRALLKLGMAGAFLLVLQLILQGVPAGVLGYGFRTYFLHTPLIFVVPAVLGADDLKRLGKCILLLTMPMALLMAAQFAAPPEAWINRAPGLEGGRQLLAALDKIRPPGTFSFVTGPVSFFALASAFLLYAVRSGREEYPGWLQAGAIAALILALAVSGSRASLVAVGVVVAGWLLSMVAAHQVKPRAGRTLFLAGISLLVLAQVELFREGTEVLSTRWEMAGEAELASGGMIGRALETLWAPLLMLPGVPLLGAGFGVGTNVGATLLTGRPQFLLSEGEWGRMVLELGPVGGVLFIAMRVSLAIWLARHSVRCATAGNILPMLLFSACAANLVTGQIAQPTILGFTALGTGLCFAAIQTSPAAEERSARDQRRPRPFVPLTRLDSATPHRGNGVMGS